MNIHSNSCNIKTKLLDRHKNRHGNMNLDPKHLESTISTFKKNLLQHHGPCQSFRRKRMASGWGPGPPSGRSPAPPCPEGAATPPHRRGATTSMADGLGDEVRAQRPPPQLAEQLFTWALRPRALPRALSTSELFEALPSTALVATRRSVAAIALPPRISLLTGAPPSEPFRQLDRSLAGFVHLQAHWSITLTASLVGSSCGVSRDLSRSRTRGRGGFAQAIRNSVP